MIEQQVTILCPKTGVVVETGQTVATATEFREGQFGGVLDPCPECGEKHVWTKAMAMPSFRQ